MDVTRPRDRFWLEEPLPDDSRVRGNWQLGMATVVTHTAAGPGWKRLTLQASHLEKGVRAGHFAMLNEPPLHGMCSDPYLKHPFYLGLVQGNRDEVQVVYRVSDRVAAQFQGLQAGSKLEYIGPLGHSFPDPTARKGALLLIGAADALPAVALATWEARQAGRAVTLRIVGDAGDSPEIHELSPAEHLGIESLSRTAWPAEAAQLEHQIHSGQFAEVWAAGPASLMSTVARMTVPARVPCFITVHRTIACGIGTCLVCTVPAAGGGHWRACADGPVLPAEEVFLDG